MIGSRFGTSADEALVRDLRAVGTPLHGSHSLDPLMEQIGDARYVLLGEATHGTSEFYTWRTEISRRLIEEKGFSFIAVEGDWPDCYRVNRYVKGDSSAGNTARAVLHTFNRWPTWMWANEEVVALVEWLRQHNEEQPANRRVGFYGLDVYSLWDSLHAVLGYLARTDPGAVESAIRAFRCFEPYGEDPQEYAWATMLIPQSCEDRVVQMLRELRSRAHEYAEAAAGDGESYFNAEQNALVALNAERYHRTMVRGGAASWNVRDCHMMETLDRLMAHHGPDAKAIVWEHNTHVGDARATDMARDGMVNIGQLAREQHAAEGVVLVGFGTHRGSVIAGRRWDAPMERIAVPEAREGSWEDLLHRAGGDRLVRLCPEMSASWKDLRGHRAIGVVYNPENERFGNYVPTVLPARYDAFLFIDRTQAVRPLHLTVQPSEELPETFPSGV